LEGGRVLEDKGGRSAGAKGVKKHGWEGGRGKDLAMTNDRSRSMDLGGGGRKSLVEKVKKRDTCITGGEKKPFLE